MVNPYEVIQDLKLEGDYISQEGCVSLMEEYLRKSINTPEMKDFLKGVELEAAHQTERWGVQNEESKYPHDYVLVLDHLKGKLANDIWKKDSEKYMHHLITIAAVCFNAHRQVNKDGTVINRFFNTPTPTPPPTVEKTFF